MERVETRVRIRGGKWTTRLAFFSFHPSRLFVSGKLSGETRRYPSNRLRSQPFSSNAPFALRATTLPKLNQEIPFAFRLAYGVSHRGKWKQEEDRTTAEPGKKFRSSSKKSPLLSGLLYLFNSVWDVSAICAATMTREKERRICSFQFFFLEIYG